MQTIFIACSNVPQVIQILQNTVNYLSQWFIKNYFNFSTIKTTVIHFCWKRRCDHSLTICINNTIITTADTVKYPGLIFDHKLTRTAYINNLKQSCLKNFILWKNFLALHMELLDTHFFTSISHAFAQNTTMVLLSTLPLKRILLIDLIWCITQQSDLPLEHFIHFQDVTTTQLICWLTSDLSAYTSYKLSHTKHLKTLSSHHTQQNLTQH